MTLAAVFALQLSVAPLSAQSRDPYYTDFSANYDFVYHQFETTSNVGAHVDVASTVKRDVPYLAVVGEFGVNHFDDANVVSVLGGARLRLPNAAPRLLPFGQFLLGLYHCGACTVNDFAIQAGGGLDVRVSGNDFRVRGQVDWRHTFDEFEPFNAVRVSAGIVIPLNR